MSAHFAIPATSFVIKGLIEARLKVAYGTLTPPSVTVAPPPRPAPSSTTTVEPEAPGLILYLHHAGPNAAWRNMIEPHIDSQGLAFQRSPLVLDLYYLLAATGADLEREALLGVGMSALHRNGIVSRSIIQAILGAITVPAHPTKLMDLLTGEPLSNPANQPEQITISQQPVDVDMSTKLWSALQSPIRPCAYYLVTTVFLDSAETFPPPLPVTAVSLAARPSAIPTDNLATDAALVTEESPA